MNDNKNLFACFEELINQGVDPAARSADIWDRYGTEVAVLVLDSTGFSRVSESHGIIHFLTRLMQMRQLVRPILEAHQALRARFEADNAFAAFPHPDLAIKAALEIHQAMTLSDIMLTASEALRVCIGIGYGRMLYSETL